MTKAVRRDVLDISPRVVLVIPGDHVEVNHGDLVPTAQLLN